MLEPIETLRMPMDLPYPQSPQYSCGKYGEWALRDKPLESIERLFTDFDNEPPGNYLIKNGHIWMSTSRLERESHAIHLKHAKGNVLVCGVGMGMYLFNIAAKPEVEKIIAVDLDPVILDLVQQATGFKSWVGWDKITFVRKDALELSPEDLGPEQIDYLYIDIWPELGNPEALAQTRMIQSVVDAKRVGWWGQEIDFMDWLSGHRAKNHLPVTADLADFMRAVGMRVEEQTANYLMGCRQADQVFAKYRATLFMPSV